MRPVTVVGVGDDGCAGLSSRAVNAVAQAQVLAGGERHLAFFPQFQGKKVVLGAGLSHTVELLAGEAQENNVCVLASGDPLFFGVGGLLAKKIGREHISFLPQPSSVQWAFARLGLPWEDAGFLSVHGKPLAGVAVRLRSLAKAACLTDGINTPPAIAAHLLAYGQSDWQAWVGENLGGADERMRGFSLEELAGAEDISPLNLLILARREGWQPPPVTGFLDEAEFARKTPKTGLITKREVRMISLARMAVTPESVVWDIGAGSGSVAVEAAWMADRGRVTAVEMDPQGADHCRANALAHGADNLTVVEGRAPEALAGLEPPDAVFIGGTRGGMEPVLVAAHTALKPGGRLVVNAVTLENVGEAYQGFKKLGLDPDVTLMQISRGIPLKGQTTHYTRYEALNPIHIFSAVKPQNG
ncbi:MAG: precorrin-6y C5,15-methyltransferase (decarboxylating) subunit CbiE [Deltaproteobacteria bacterium]|nr:precorrin-6y C5,15-methyltransferase (decarboxylating) subunit CbiE [Deltaproteobacteria bacterium]